MNRPEDTPPYIYTPDGELSIMDTCLVFGRDGRPDLDHYSGQPGARHLPRPRVNTLEEMCEYASGFLCATIGSRLSPRKLYMSSHTGETYFIFDIFFIAAIEQYKGTWTPEWFRGDDGLWKVRQAFRGEDIA